MASYARRGNCSVGAFHPRHPRPFGTAVRFASGFLRNQCSLVTMQVSPRVRSVSEYSSKVSLSKQKAHHKSELFVLMVETAGIEPASASPLQAVLHT